MMDERAAPMHSVPHFNGDLSEKHPRRLGLRPQGSVPSAPQVRDESERIVLNPRWEGRSTHGTK